MNWFPYITFHKRNFSSLPTEARNFEFAEKATCNTALEWPSRPLTRAHTSKLQTRIVQSRLVVTKNSPLRKKRAELILALWPTILFIFLHCPSRMDQTTTELSLLPVANWFPSEEKETELTYPVCSLSVSNSANVSRLMRVTENSFVPHATNVPLGDTSKVAILILICFKMVAVPISQITKNKPSLAVSRVSPFDE